MHLLDLYADHYDLEVKKPFVLEKYYPMAGTKFLSLHVGNEQGDQLTYPYWQEVINLCKPTLDKIGISFLLTNGSLKMKYNNCTQMDGQLSLNELAYVIKSSLIHISEGDFDLDIASGYDKKIIFLDKENNKERNRPYWEKESAFINELEKDIPIQKIKPEKIAKTIFKFLDIDYSFDYSTVFIGGSYLNKSIQIIPNQDINVENNNFGSPIVVRMDKVFNEEVLANQLSRYACIIVTKKAINEQIINSFNKNIVHVSYLIGEDDDPKFIDTLRRANVNGHLMSKLENEKLNKKKINYMDYGVINKIIIPSQNDIEELKNEDINSLLYMSNGVVLSEGKVYKSIFDWENNAASEEFNRPTPIRLNESFWEEVSNLYLIKKKGS
ncbi:hypothetical protein CL634_07055 [bacterium]|nr:hypothetical protein [bacterium]|tara:strand:- start:2725 stop:3873 length:1149 start_codon:yes stop_codon:yes gene_type:complete